MVVFIESVEDTNQVSKSSVEDDVNVREVLKEVGFEFHLDFNKVNNHLVFSVELYESSEIVFIDNLHVVDDFCNQHASLDHM